MRQLLLNKLEKGLPAITKSMGITFVEAGVYCFHQANHKSGVEIKIEGAFRTSFEIIWNNQITSQLLRTWNNTKEATEYGAVGIAILLIERLLNLTIVMRSREGTGIDYWLGKMGKNDLPIIKAGLEISGIQEVKGSNTINARLTLKKKQVEKTKQKGIPVYIIVIEFKSPQAKIIK